MAAEAACGSMGCRPHHRRWGQGTQERFGAGSSSRAQRELNKQEEKTRFAAFIRQLALLHIVQADQSKRLDVPARLCEAHRRQRQALEGDDHANLNIAMIRPAKGHHKAA